MIKRVDAWYSSTASKLFSKEAQPDSQMSVFLSSQNPVTVKRSFVHSEGLVYPYIKCATICMLKI